MTHILITGRNFKTLKDKIVSRGDEYLLLADSVIVKNQDKNYPHRVLADFSSKEALLADVKNLKSPIHGIMVIYENYVLPSAWIAEYLNLPGMPISAAEACTDKYMMRTLFQAAPEKISPEFAEITSFEEAKSFANKHTYPVILKPANLAKSLLVTKNHTEEELQKNFEKMTQQIQDIYKKYAPHRTPKILIEEFMVGTIHSVDAFVDREGTPHVLEQVVDYQTGYDIGYDDNFHYSRLLPSTLPLDEQQALRHVAELGIQALGMKNSPAHVEIIMTKNGPRIVEIGARNGGYRERMHDLANGIDILGASIDLCLGKKPAVTAIKNDPCAVLELFPKVQGTFAHIENEEQLRKLSSLKYLSIKPSVGQVVGKSSDGYKTCAVIILNNTDHEQFARDLKFVNESVRVVTI